jgi:hypothetical protein
MNILNYKLLARKYITLNEDDGLVHEYTLTNSHSLLFENNYLNKQRNGGKEKYDEIVNINLIFKWKKRNEDGYDKK